MSLTSSAQTISAAAAVAAALTMTPSVADAQPPAPASVGEVVALLEAHGTSAADPALASLKEFLARNGDTGLPLANADRKIEMVGPPPGCDKPVSGFEISAQPDGPDVAAMVYNRWVADIPGHPGILSPASGVNFVFINVTVFPPLVGTVPWEQTKNRTHVTGDPQYGRFRGNYIVRYSGLTEMGPGNIVGLFVGQDTPTGGPGCIYNTVVAANGSSVGSCLDALCPGPRPYDSNPPPYGPPWLLPR